MRGRWFAAAAAAAVLIAGAGSAHASSGRTDRLGGGQQTVASADASRQNALPDVEVVRLADGQRVNLRSLAVAGKPILLWFWAPHCPFCKAEAPKVVNFAARHGAKVQVLGLGAQDDLDQAYGFRKETGTGGLAMVWDRSGKSWRDYRVTNQPTVVVLNGEGKEVKRFFRTFDEAAILAAANAR
ncbi:MAG: TlpA family protein disulfide reductase [Sporichthyaceae bacterium]